MKVTRFLFALLFFIFIYVAAADVVPEQTQHPETKKEETDEVDTSGEEPVAEPETSTIFGYVSSPDVTSSVFFPKNPTKSNFRFFF